MHLLAFRTRSLNAIRFTLIALITSCAAVTLAAEDACLQVVICPETVVEHLPESVDAISFRRVSEQTARMAVDRINNVEKLDFLGCEFAGGAMWPALARHRNTLSALTMRRVRATDLDGFLKTLSDLTVLNTLSIQDMVFLEQRDELEQREFVEIFAEKMHLDDWGILARGVFPRLTTLTMSVDIEDPGLAVRLALDWPDKMPLLRNIEFTFYKPGVAALLIVEQTAGLRSLQVDWMGEPSSATAALVMERLLRRVESATLLSLPGDQEGAPIWRGIAESGTLRCLRIGGSPLVDKLRDALIENESLASIRIDVWVGGSDWTEKIRAIVRDTQITEFTFGTGTLDFLKGIPDERLSELSVAFERDIYLADAEGINQLFKTRPVDSLHFSSWNLSAGDELASMEVALVSGLKRWSSLSELTWDLYLEAPKKSNYWLPAAIVDVIRQLSELKRLDIGVLQAERWRTGINMPKLESLSVGRLEGKFPYRDVIRHMPALRVLHIRDCPAETFDAAEVRSLPALAELRLGWSGDFSSAFAEILKSPTLRKLTLSGEGRFSPSGIAKADVKAPLVVLNVYMDNDTAEATHAIKLKELIPTLRVIVLINFDLADFPEVREYFTKHPEVRLNWRVQLPDDEHECRD